MSLALTSRIRIDWTVVHPSAVPGSEGSAEDPSPFVRMSSPAQDLRDMRFAEETVIPGPVGEKGIYVRCEYPLGRVS